MKWRQRDRRAVCWWHPEVMHDLKPLRILLIVLVGVSVAASVQAQPAPSPASPRAQDEAAPEEEAPQAPKAVDVQPVARDEEIRERLLSILQATTWFENPQVEVREGVVFLDGRTRLKEYRVWARDLASNTQDVVAVVNRIDIIERSPWDFSPARNVLWQLWRDTVQALPFIGFGLVVLVITWWATKGVSRLARHFFFAAASPVCYCAMSLPKR